MTTEYAALTEACNNIRATLDNYQPTYRTTSDWSVAADITNGTATALVIINPEHHVIIGRRTDRNPAWTREGYTTGEDIAATIDALLDA